MILASRSAARAAPRFSARGLQLASAAAAHEPPGLFGIRGLNAPDDFDKLARRAVAESEARRARLETEAAVDATESAADAAIARLEAARLAGIARLAPDTGNGADAWQLYKAVV